MILSEKSWKKMKEKYHNGLSEKIKYILLKNFRKCVTYSCMIDDDYCYGEMSRFWNVWNASVILVHAGRVSNLETALCEEFGKSVLSIW